MRFEYTGRHVLVTPAIRRHVEEQFSKLEHIFNSGADPRVHVILAVEKNRQTGEVVVNWRDHTLTATDTNADMYMALSRAIAKIEKQATKLKQRVIDRKHTARKTSDVAPNPRGWFTPRTRREESNAPRWSSVFAKDGSSRTLRSSCGFCDADTSRLGVLYKRQDGNFGLIEP